MHFMAGDSKTFGRGFQFSFLDPSSYLLVIMPEGSYARMADHPPHSASFHFELAFSVYGSVFMALHNFSFHPG